MQRKNTEPYISTYLHQKGRRLGLPIAGNFELTARCNFNCPMCYVHMTEEQVKENGKELTAQQWLDIARAARDKGMIFVLLTGGEPLVRKHIALRLILVYFSCKLIYNQIKVMPFRQVIQRPL